MYHASALTTEWVLHTPGNIFQFSLWLHIVILKFLPEHSPPKWYCPKYLTDVILHITVTVYLIHDLVTLGQFQPNLSQSIHCWFASEGPHSFQREDNYNKIAKIKLQHQNSLIYEKADVRKVVYCELLCFSFIKLFQKSFASWNKKISGKV